MYYKEEIINGILCKKNYPKGKFVEFTKEELTERIMSMQTTIDILKTQKSDYTVKYF